MGHLILTLTPEVGVIIFPFYRGEPWSSSEKRAQGPQRQSGKTQIQALLWLHSSHSFLLPVLLSGIHERSELHSVGRSVSGQRWGRLSLSKELGGHILAGPFEEKVDVGRWRRWRELCEEFLGQMQRMVIDFTYGRDLCLRLS